MLTNEINWVDSTGKIIWEGDEAAINFGKHKGQTLREIAKVEPDFFNWIMQKDFPQDVKDIIAKAEAGQFPVKNKS